MLAGLGHDVSAYGVASMYRGLINGFVIDQSDEDQQERIAALGMRVLVTDTVMRDEDDRRRLAAEVLELARSWPW
jgi:LPPG:FO 2-phospho-L-lactate transferase